MTTQPSPGGFSLFPNPNATAGPSRNQTPRPRATTPQNGSREAPSAFSVTPETTSPRSRHVDRKQSVREGKQPESTAIATANGNGNNSSGHGRQQEEEVTIATAAAVIIQRPAHPTEVPPRCETAFSDAQTLVKSNSTRSRSSIAKPPIQSEIGSNSGSSNPSYSGVAGEPQALKSIFPVYNHSLPLDRQEYYPTQASPNHIPRAAISRPLYSPTENASQVQQQHTPPQPQQQTYQHHSPQQEHPQTGSRDMASPRPSRGGQATATTTVPAPVARRQSTGSTTHRAAVGATSGPARWPPRPAEPPVKPSISNTEELRGLWKVVNGWKAPPSEGRVYCLKMTAERDTPVYTLSSSSQPFYNLRIDPTSASAYVTLSRHDPSKLYKGPQPGDLVPDLSDPSGSSPAPASVVGTGKDGKYWQEALITTLEEESRKHAPNDGLVALLYPTAAAKVALERPDDTTIVMTAEMECARLVWDDDTGNHFLVHPALAVPFCVTVERNPAWSRTEYTLEHLESPQHIARLTRDGTGNGWLEVDTAIAAKVESVYLVDVAIAALMLVAHGDKQFQHVEAFEPPPQLPPPIFGAPPGSDGGVARSGSATGNRRGSGRMSRLSAVAPTFGDRKSKKSVKKSGRRMEQFELDIESQSSDLAKPGSRKKEKDEDKLPMPIRAIIKLIKITLKCFLWILTACFKCLAGTVSLLAKCVSSEKK